MKLVNLQRYVPDVLFNGEGIQYFIDADGNDWFKSLPKFTKKFSLAIDNDTGVVRSISEDASRLYPVGLTVVEVDSLPDGCDIFGDWVYKNNKVVPRDIPKIEKESIAKNKQTLLIDLATKAMAPLQDAKELNIATGDELSKLNVWMSYRVAVSRVDTTQVDDIEWPEAPKDITNG